MESSPDADGYDFIEFIRQARKAGIPCVLYSSIPGGSAGRKLVYTLGRKAYDAGAAFALDTGAPAAWVKMQWLRGNQIVSSPDDFFAAFQTSFAGEVTTDGAIQIATQAAEGSTD